MEREEGGNEKSRKGIIGKGRGRKERRKEKGKKERNMEMDRHGRRRWEERKSKRNICK